MTLDILVTAHHGGDLAYLERLYTALRQIRGGLTGHVLQIDTGLAWSSQSEICQITQNRAPYLVMDAMGYDYAFADGLDTDARQKISDQLQMTLVLPTQTIQTVGWMVERDDNLTQPQLNEKKLLLGLPPKQKIWQLTLTENEMTVTEIAIVPQSHLPDPTIAATVEFVLSEARYYQKMQHNTESKDR